MNIRKRTHEEEAYFDLATLYVADLDEDHGTEILDYAVITTAIRHYLKGVSADFLKQAIDQLSGAESIDLIDPRPDPSRN